MIEKSPISWMTSIKSGDALLVVKHARLWMPEMWWSSADDDTIIVATPILAPGDICGVIDTLTDEKDHCVYAALIVCSEGIGCILTNADHFKPL